MIKLFDGIEILGNLVSVGGLIFLNEHGTNKAKTREGKMLVLLNVLDEGVSELYKKCIEKVQVFLEDSLIVIHDDSLEDVVVDLDDVNDLLEYLRENLEDLREFGRFKDTLKGFEPFENEDFA